MNFRLLITDAHTEDLFTSDKSSHEQVIFPVSHLAVDPERFVNELRNPCQMLRSKLIAVLEGLNWLESK